MNLCDRCRGEEDGWNEGCSLVVGGATSATLASSLTAGVLPSFSASV